MPHVRMLFVDEPHMRRFLHTNKGIFRSIVAEVLGHEPEEIAVIPDLIRAENMYLADNVLPLEFVIDAGTRWADRAKEVPAEIKRRILVECAGAASINFGVWPRSFQSGYAEHKP